MKYSIFFTIISAVILATCFGTCKPKFRPYCCIDFNSSSSFPLNTTYHVRNDSVYYSCSYIVRTDSLYLNGIGYYNFGRIEYAKPIFGVRQILNTNNITLKFTNVAVAKPVTITLEYLDMGGNENLSINGSLYAGDLTAAPVSLGSATVSVTSTPIPLPAKGHKGTVTISGTIKNFKIGGQEFYLDNICFK